MESEGGARSIPDIVPGFQLGSYRIEAQLGEGGMGVVYRAFDTKLNRPVAVKFLSDELSDTAARRRFQREAQMASSLNHPHILTVYDAGEFDGRQYLITQYGVLVGSVPYMSPEQAAGKPLDARSDIFSFGVVLFEMFAGRRPFEGATTLEVLEAIVHRSPPPIGRLCPDLPERLRILIEK